MSQMWRQSQILTTLGDWKRIVRAAPHKLIVAAAPSWPQMQRWRQILLATPRDSKSPFLRWMLGVATASSRLVVAVAAAPSWLVVGVAAAPSKKLDMEVAALLG